MSTRRSTRSPVYTVSAWVKRQPPKIKGFLAVVTAMASLVLLRFIVHDHDNLFVAAEASHAIGISVLIYKLTKERTCAASDDTMACFSTYHEPENFRALLLCIDAISYLVCALYLFYESLVFQLLVFVITCGRAAYIKTAGLSLKSQELTAIFLAIRLYCSLVMEYDIHTVLDTTSLLTTLWVIYMIRFKLRSSYMEEKDNFAIYYVVIPCLLLALLIHPSTSHLLLNRICWAFCVYLEAVSVLPQLRVMQNTKIVESFTAHYVFALGIARFLSCAHWVLQVLESRGYLLIALGHGLWPSMVLLSEIVQTFILADFCYYYVQSVVGGHLVLRLPSGVV